VAFAAKQGGQALAPLRAMVEELNQPPTNAGIDMSHVDQLLNIVGTNSDAMRNGGGMVIAGGVLMIFAQVVFLTSYTVTYGASDVAKKINDSLTEKSPLLSSLLPFGKGPASQKMAGTV